jgi:hypothetical protein
MLEHDMFKVKTCQMNELGKTLRKKIVSHVGNVLAIKVLIALTFYRAYAPVHLQNGQRFFMQDCFKVVE